MEFTCRQILNMHIFGIIVRREAGFIRFQHELCAAQFSQLPNYHSFYMMISPFQDLSKFSREPRSPSRGSEAPWIYDPGIWGDMHCILTWIVFSIFYSASSLKSSLKLSLIFNVRFLVARMSKNKGDERYVCIDCGFRGTDGKGVRRKNKRSHEESSKHG